MNQSWWGDLITRGKLSLGSGDSLTKTAQREVKIPIYGGNGVQGYHDKHNHEPGVISIGRVGALCGCVHHVDERCWVTDNSFALVVHDRTLIVPQFLAAVLHAANLNQFKNLGAQPNINQQAVKQRRIPLPSLREQERIVAELDAKLALLSGLRSLRDEAERDIRQTLNRIWES